MNLMKWMAGNHVAANIIMVILLVGGLIIGGNIKEEVFPTVDPGKVQILVPYPGASPEEVEQGICLQVEEAISGIDGIKSVTASASEGMGAVTAELIENINAEKALDDIKAAVDRITTFPEEIEDPQVTAMEPKNKVISLVVYGDLTDRDLSDLADEIRDDLLLHSDITQVEISGVKRHEISVEISEENLRRYSLTHDDVADAIRKASLDLPGGEVKTSGGDILVRTKAKKYVEREYSQIVLRSFADGTTLKLGDIANIKDGFEESDERALFDGKPAAMVQVFRVGDQRPTKISDLVKAYIEKKSPELPRTAKIAIWNDDSQILRDRMALLYRNAQMGLILVIIVLGLFLEVRLAFWVMMGIPVSFLGGMMLMPMLDVSINLVSLFAFILCLGIVVDDAIVVGESVYYHRQLGKTGYRAAVDGVSEVAGPVLFAVLTNIVVFLPMMFVSGVMGQIFRHIPLIVIPVFTVSLLESVFILPAHLNRHDKGGEPRFAPFRWLAAFRRKFDKGLEAYVEKIVGPSVDWSTRYRLLTVALAMMLLLVSFGIVRGGIIKFEFFPRIEGDEMAVKLTLPFGTPVEVTRAHMDHILNTAKKQLGEKDTLRADGKSNVLHIYAVSGGHMEGRGHAMVEGASSGSHLAEVAILLEPLGVRNFSAMDFVNSWRKEVGEIPGAESLSYAANLMRPGHPIDIQMAHKDPKILEEVGEKMKLALAEYPALSEIEDNVPVGKRELRINLTQDGRSRGLSERDLARQVRGGFYGSEALRIQRGRNEVKVMVRYPEQERKTMNDLETMRIRTPDGGEIPFLQCAELLDGRGYGKIQRMNRKRVLNVSSDINYAMNKPDEILALLRRDVFPKLQDQYPGLSFGMEGEEKDRRESVGSLMRGFAMAILAIFGLLAIQFKSYVQPLLIMTAIPFGFVGAMLGHLLLGYDISMVSMFGLVALSGVVVNDSLVLIDFVNSQRILGLNAHDAVVLAAKRRFRPIMLTSLTTFFGIMPMILETSLQARFLIPMAIALGCGVMFSTLITLMLVPALYMLLDDILGFLGMRQERFMTETSDSPNPALQQPAGE